MSKDHTTFDLVLALDSQGKLSAQRKRITKPQITLEYLAEVKGKQDK